MKATLVRGAMSTYSLVLDGRPKVFVAGQPQAITPEEKALLEKATEKRATPNGVVDVPIFEFTQDDEPAPVSEMERTIPVTGGAPASEPPAQDPPPSSPDPASLSASVQPDIPTSDMPDDPKVSTEHKTFEDQGKFAERPDVAGALAAQSSAAPEPPVMVPMDPLPKVE